MKVATQQDAVEWRISDRPVGYEDAVRAMEERVAAIRAGQARADEFIVHRRPDRKTGWAVTHVETGAQAGKGASRQKAEADAFQRMARHTEESFRRVVDAARNK